MYRKKYNAPYLTVELVEIEDSIAAGSADVRVGTARNQYTPDIDEWNEGGSRSTDLDI